MSNNRTPVDKEIKIAKKLNRNIFRKFNFGRNFWLDAIYAVITSAVLSNFIADLLKIDKNIVAISATLIVIVARQTKEYCEFPKPFCANKLFVGLCNTAGLMMRKTGQENDDTQNGVPEMNWFISREAEEKHLTELIKDTFKNGKNVEKKGICLAGASGCGKTVLISKIAKNLQEQKNPSLFDVCCFDDIYNYNREEDDFCKETWNERIFKAAEGKHFLAIFDQFEKVLQLDTEEKAFVLRRIGTLSENENVMLLFSIREEYLLLFLETFSIDSAKECKDESAWTYVSVKNLVKCTNKKDMGGVSTPQIKSNADGNLGRNLLIPYIIMLESRYNHLPNETVEKKMVGKCKNPCVGNPDEFENVYAVVRDKPLIEQQIILNMKSQHEKLPGNFEEAYESRQFAVLMKDYYDVQLCSTGQYLTACQIMYILSKARMDNIEVYENTLKDAICIADEFEKKRFKECLDELIGLQLVKREETNSLEEKYEVTHDFVSKSFCEYAVMYLSSEIRCALDDAYTSSVVDNTKRKVGSTDVMDAYRSKIDSDGWITAVWIFSLTAVLFRLIIQRVVTSYGSIEKFIESTSIGKYIPMSNTICKLDSCINLWGTITIPVMVMSIISLFYIYNFYRNITQFYGISATKKSSGKSKVFSRRYLTVVLYYLSMLCGTVAAFSQDFWLLWLGLGNMFNGFACVFISYDKRISLNGSDAFSSYGWKTMLCSVLLVVGSIVAFTIEVSNDVGIIMKEFIQLFCMAVLLLFSYHVHIKREYFYVRVQALLHMRSVCN